MDGRGRPPFDFPFGRSDSNKRSYTQMAATHRSSPSPLFVRQNSATPDRHPTPPIARLALPPLRSHYPRDGFDFRRPASTRFNQTANDVIDLTSDDESAPSNVPTPQPEASAGPSRLPRFSREIIDLSADTSPAQPQSSRYAERPSSPEVQFVSSRPRSPTGRPPSQAPPFLDPHQYRRPTADLILDNEDDDDVIISGSRTGVNLLTPFGAQRRPDIGRLAHLVFSEGGRRLRAFAMAQGGPMPALFGSADDGGFLAHNPHAHAIFSRLPMPGSMNYETVAFDLGHGDEPPQQPIPKFDSPPPVADGYTRDPTEEDTIVCPNCDDELAVGETEEKRQVWVVKACGHVYCGACMNNRKGKKAKSTKSAKGKGRADDPTLPKPFSHCRADDCGGRVSHKNDVMQVFL